MKKIGFADVENIKASEKIKALGLMSRLLGYDRECTDENIEDITVAESEVFDDDS